MAEDTSVDDLREARQTVDQYLDEGYDDPDVGLQLGFAIEHIDSVIETVEEVESDG